MGRIDLLKRSSVGFPADEEQYKKKRSSVGFPADEE